MVIGCSVIVKKGGEGYQEESEKKEKYETGFLWHIQEAKAEEGCFWPSRSFVQIRKDPFLFNNWGVDCVALVVEQCTVAGTSWRKLE